MGRRMSFKTVKPEEIMLILLKVYFGDKLVESVLIR